MNITIAALLILLSFFFPKKLIWVRLLFFFMWSLWGWNTFNGDYEAYQIGFEQAMDSSNTLNEFGYKWLNFFLWRLGLSFRGYYVLVSGLLLFGMYYMIKKTCPLPGLYSALYFFTFIQYYVYLRNYIICVVLILVLYKLIKDNIPQYVYIATCVLLSTIHSISIMFLLFTPAIKNKCIGARRILIMELGCFVLAYVGFNFLVGSILPYMSFSERALAYIDHASVGMSIIFFVCFVLMSLYVLKKFMLVSNNKEVLKYIRVLYNINLLSLFICSICVVAPYTIGRFLMFLIPINILSGVYFYYECSVNRRYKVLASAYLIVLACSVFLFLSMSNHPFTTIPLFMCNEIWGNNYYVPDLSLSNTQN